MRRRFFLTPLALIALTLAACSTGPKKDARFDFGAPKKTYALHGVVLRLRPEDRLAVIKHDKIGDWMEAMTMDFPVPSETDFAKLKEGVTVDATVNVNDAYFWLTNVKVQ